jgi:Mo-dependent nitrogenase C-terminus
MSATNYSTENRSLTTWTWIEQSNIIQPKKHFDPLQRVRRLLENVEVRDRDLAHQLCQMIPAQCPFERDVKLFGRTLFHIPPLCKLNPLYEEVVALRFRALCYLADECGEDVSCYC